MNFKISLQELTEKEKKIHTKRILEALLFSSAEPILFQKLHEIVQDFHPFLEHELKKIIEELKSDYLENMHAFQLDEIAGGYILRTSTLFSPYIEKLRGKKRCEKLSQAGIETLAIIAHKQPVSRANIEALRGVDSSGILQTLQERDLIEIVGKQEAPGRPSLYGVTEKFLHYFGIKSLKDLPNATTSSSLKQE